jgi:hypothetical protein
MAGFRKAKGEQAALKMGMYGPAGSGKTFTSLLIAEGLAKITGKRTAFVDTEHGTDFYSQPVATRDVHPDAFDFDALYTRSITETTKELKALDPSIHGQIIVDSMTHLWEACREAYTGRTTSVGTIPMQAWGKIKKPYKELMSFLLSTPMHVIILGREGTEYATDEETEELKAVGKKMKAEGETAYEPHILIRMEQIKARKTNEKGSVVAYIEKDRTGVLSGRSFLNPTFEMLGKPLLPLLGAVQAQIEGTDETAQKDADEIAAQDAERTKNSAEHLRKFSLAIMAAHDLRALKAVGGDITPKLKAQMTPADVEKLREAYLVREAELPKG